MSVRTALALINQTLDEVLAEQEGDFDGDTRWALAWFEQCGWLQRRRVWRRRDLSKAKNTPSDGLVERRASSNPTGARCGCSGAKNCPPTGTRRPTTRSHGLGERCTI